MLTNNYTRKRIATSNLARIISKDLRIISCNVVRLTFCILKKHAAINNLQTYEKSFVVHFYYKYERIHLNERK